MTPGPLTRGAALRPETRGWVLGLVLGLGGLVCLSLAADPLEATPRGVDLDPMRVVILPVVAAALLLLAVPAIVLRRHRRALWAVLVVAVLVDSVLLATTRSSAGQVLVSMSYTYAVLYAAYAFDRAAFHSVLGVVAVGSLVGSAVSTPGLRPVVWAATVGGVLVAGVVLGHVMRLLRWYATVDALTGVLTRTAFDASAHSALSGARRRGVTAVLVLIDLDGFKAVNDTHGHAAGDTLLVRSVEAWRQRLRGQDLLGRSGGDEFVLLLPDTGLVGARHLVDALGEVSPIGFSAGLALAGEEDSLEDLMRRADAGMYEVKRTRSESP